MAGIAEEALAPLVPKETAGFRRYVKREPAGIVLVIAPWNYPFLTAGNTIFPALMAGNAVLLKHAAQTLLVGERFQAAADKAGLPKGLFQNIVLGHEQTEKLIASGKVESRQLHRLGRRRQGDRARRGRHLRLGRPRARRQGSGLCHARRETRPCDREPRRRRVLQFRPVLLRDRAHLCPREGLRAVPRRLCRSHEEISWSAIRSKRRRRSVRWRGQASPTTCATTARRRCARAPSRISG